GGPRWIDDQTCQVRLEISGQRVAQALISIAQSNPKKSPIAPELLTGRLRDWNERTFSATGTSTGAAAIEMVRPTDESPAWSRVSDQARQDAITAAKQDAVHKVIESIKPIELVKDALNDAQIQRELERWLASPPVTEVE